MTKIKYILFSILVNIMILFSSEMKILNGKVYSTKTGEGIPDVNLYIPSQKLGVATLEDGSFSLNYFPENNLILRVSHIGYASKRITLKKNIEDLTLALEEIFFNMEEVVITSTRSNKIHNNVPIATEIITKKEINDSGALNVADLLTQRSGVALKTSVEGGSSLHILGLDSRYILILIDNQPITGKFNSRVALDQIPTSQIKNIEIIKGPSSSLYGSEAMAGVVNIITNDQHQSKSLNLKYRYGNSEYNIKNEGLDYGSGSLKLNGATQIKGLNLLFNAELENIKADKAIQQIDIDNIYKQSILTNISWNNSDKHKYSMREIFYNHKENGTSTLMETNTHILRNNFAITHNWLLNNKFSLSHSLQHQIYERKYLQSRPYNNDNVTDDKTTEQSIEYESIIQKKINDGEINFGLEVSQSYYTSDRVKSGKQIISTNSIFGQYDKYIMENLNIILGTRLDKYSEHDIVFSPRFGLMYLFMEHWKIRATWGKGFRAPSFMERFIDWNHIQFGYQVLGNPDLKPERSEGYTIGFEYYDYSHYQMSVMMYYNEFSNLIEDFALQPGLLSYNNINKAVYKGIEIQNRWEISNTLTSSWGLNIIDNKDGDGNEIPNTQTHSSYAYINYQHPHLKYSLSTNIKWIGASTTHEYDPNSGIYKSTGEIAEHFIIDGNIKTIFGNLMDLIVGIKNIGDYTNTEIGPFIGRSFYLEITRKII